LLAQSFRYMLIYISLAAIAHSRLLKPYGNNGEVLTERSLDKGEEAGDLDRMFLVYGGHSGHMPQPVEQPKTFAEKTEWSGSLNLVHFAPNPPPIMASRYQIQWPPLARLSVMRADDRNFFFTKKPLLLPQPPRPAAGILVSVRRLSRLSSSNSSSRPTKPARQCTTVPSYPHGLRLQQRRRREPVCPRQRQRFPARNAELKVQWAHVIL